MVAASPIGVCKTLRPDVVGPGRTVPGDGALADPPFAPDRSIAAEGELAEYRDEPAAAAFLGAAEPEFRPDGFGSRLSSNVAAFFGKLGIEGRL